MQRGVGVLCMFFSLTVLGQQAKNMSLIKQWISSDATGYNDVWGYEANGREYAILGSNWGTHFIDITNDLSEAEEIASFEGLANDVTWRDVKTYSHYAYGVADGDTNSLQIFDLQYLPDSVLKVFDSPTLSESSHNIYIAGDRLYFCANQINQNKSSQALHVFSLADPAFPVELRAFDKSYFGNELLHDIHVRDNIAYCSAGYGGLYIYDLSDIQNEQLLGVLDVYPDQGYNHSSWLSDDKTKLVVADEVPSGLAMKLFDISDIENIEFLDRFKSHNQATPHNPFIVGDFIIISYYMDGVVVFDQSDPYDVQKVAYYDTYPDDTNYTDFGPYKGCWGAYPFLPSGNILGSDRTYGLHVLDLDIAALTSTNEKEAFSHPRIFPNPSDGETMTLVSKKDIVSIDIYDIRGMYVALSSYTTGATITFHTGNLSPGMYYTRVTYRNGSTETLKFIRK